MAVVLDASTPAAVVNTTLHAASVTTASFTPPTGSLLVAMAAAGDSTTMEDTLTISDSTSSSWTLITNTIHQYVWYRVVGSSTAMTVTADSHTDASGIQLAVQVLTGQASSPIGATTTNVELSVPHGTITPTWIGSYLLSVAGDASSNDSWTVEPGNTTILLTSDATNAATYAMQNLTGTTTSLSPVTMGYTGGSTNSAFIAVEIKPAPSAPAVSTNTATSYGSTVEMVTGTVNPEGTSTTVKVDYGIGSYGSSTSTTSIGSGWSGVGVSIPVSGLSVNTTYQYRITATNAGGTTYSTGTFTTLPTPNPSGGLGLGPLGGAGLGYNKVASAVNSGFFVFF